MENVRLAEEIENILDVSKVGVLSTAFDNVPNSRYMIFYNDEHVLYTKTGRDSFKVEEIKENPRAHVLLGYEETSNRSFLEIMAEVEIVEDDETVDWLWKQQDKTNFESKDDPNLTVLKIVPKTIKIMNDDNLDTPETIDFTE